MENQNMVSTNQGLPSNSAPIFKKAEPIQVERKDRILAWVMFVLGYGFIDTFLSAGMHWKLKVFTVAFVLLTVVYFGGKQKQLPKETYFWFAIVGILGLSYSEQGMIFPLIQVQALIMAAAYLVLCAGGNLLDKQKSSQWVLVDGWNAMVVVPFYNFLCHIKVLGSGAKRAEKDEGHPVRSILLGIGITIPLLFLILPMLGQADVYFAVLLRRLGGYIREDVIGTFFKILLSLPVTVYLFGLFYGSLHQRNTTHFSKEQMQENMRHSRILPVIAVQTVLTVVCLVYLIFMGLQGSYLFSAFAGIRPESYTYAEYARQGFFELCKVSVLNLTILTLGNTFSKISREESKVLRLMNVALSGLTILLIITAMSKMMLYISEFGLTVKRMDTMVFMIWLMLVFVLGIVEQFRKIELVRISLIVGAILYTLLCALPVRVWMDWINVRYF